MGSYRTGDVYTYHNLIGYMRLSIGREPRRSEIANQRRLF